MGTAVAHASVAEDGAASGEGLVEQLPLARRHLLQASLLQTVLAVHQAASAVRA